MEGNLDNYMKTEIILSCLKKCINGSNLSPAVRLKVLNVLYMENSRLEEIVSKSESTSTWKTFLDSTGGNSFKYDSNFLGIDDDLLESNDEKLTKEQQHELRECIFGELKELYKFCNDINSNVTVPKFKCKTTDLINNVESNIVNASEQLQKLTEMQTSASSFKLNCSNVFEEQVEPMASSLRQLQSTGRKLLHQISEELLKGDRIHYLQEVERILEEKISSNEEKIEQLKFELLNK